MKTDKFALGLLIGFLLTLVGIGAVRDVAMQNFGPRLIEAVVRATVDEFNRNRTWHSQPQITYDQVLIAITNELPKCADYTWMNN